MEPRPSLINADAMPDSPSGPPAAWSASRVPRLRRSRP